MNNAITEFDADVVSKALAAIAPQEPSSETTSMNAYRKAMLKKKRRDAWEAARYNYPENRKVRHPEPTVFCFYTGREIFVRDAVFTTAIVDPNGNPAAFDSVCSMCMAKYERAHPGHMSSELYNKMRSTVYKFLDRQEAYENDAEMLPGMAA